MVRLKRFELLTLWFVARYSIQLSYSRSASSKNKKTGLAGLDIPNLRLTNSGVPTGNRTPAAAVKGQCSNR